MPIDNLHDKAKTYYLTEEEIQKSFPLGNPDPTTYAIRDAAMELVSERHSKSHLVNLVAALIHQREMLQQKHAMSLLTRQKL